MLWVSTMAGVCYKSLFCGRMGCGVPGAASMALLGVRMESSKRRSHPSLLGHPMDVGTMSPALF